jgi:hypothetical protein
MSGIQSRLNAISAVTNYTSNRGAVELRGNQAH